VHSYRDVIEFKCAKNPETIYVDQIGDVCVYDDGRIGYWCDIYPEVPGCGEVPHENVIAVLRKSKFAPPEVPEFKYKKGQLILYSWDTKKVNGKEEMAYHKSKITEVYCMLCMDDEPAFRIVTELGHCLCLEDGHEIAVVEDIQFVKSENKRNKRVKEDASIV